MQQEVVKTKNMTLDMPKTFKKRGHQLSAEISIFENKIAFIAPTEKFALIIQSNELADALKTIYKLNLKKSVR